MSSVEQHHVTGMVLPAPVTEWPSSIRRSENISLTCQQIQEGIFALMSCNSFIQGYFCIKSRKLLCFFINEQLDFWVDWFIKMHNEMIAWPFSQTVTECQFYKSECMEEN